MELQADLTAFSAAGEAPSEPYSKWRRNINRWQQNNTQIWRYQDQLKSEYSKFNLNLMKMIAECHVEAVLACGYVWLPYTKLKIESLKNVTTHNLKTAELKILEANK
jgi:hypothetical protein